MTLTSAHIVVATAIGAACLYGGCTVGDIDDVALSTPTELTTCADLPVASVTASGNDGNVPANVLDNNLATRWSSEGIGQFITVDLGATKALCSASVAWYRGDLRTNNFTISVSTDGTTFAQVFAGTSSGTTTALESYDFPDVAARYVRVTVNGNTENDWASITEIKVSGGSSSSGTGLSATYYDNLDFTNLKVTRIDPTVNFNWGTGSPDPSVGPDTFSARWLGQVLAPVSGTYTFTTTSDDGVRLWINGQLLVNNWTDHAPIKNSGTIALAAGQKYDLKLEYYENGGGAVMKLAWTVPGSASAIIPTSQLFPTTSAPSSDTTPPTVTIGSPASGATVSGTIAVTGTASDNVALSKVEVQVDGGAFALASGGANWTYNLNTAALSNASHTLTVRATDTSGNAKTAAVSVTVNNGTGSTTCTGQTLNPGDNLAAAITSAAPGAVICLNAGAYGGLSLSGVNKTSVVTVQSVSGASSVNIGDLNLNNVSYVYLKGVTFTGGTLKGHHLHILDSIGAAHILNGVSQILEVSGTITNADIVIDHVTYSDIPNPCTNNACVEGRISIVGGNNPSGITISNSYFSGGNSDGIQVGGGAGGVQIIGNEFTQIWAADGTHTDSIQLYGQGPGTVIKGNYIHDTETGLMAPDGGDGVQVLDNVFAMTGYPYGIVMGNWTNSVVQHNTFKYGTSCSWNSCGTLWVRTSTNLIIKDNIIGELYVESGTYTEDYNLINVNGTAHGHTIIGLPTYAGGANPSAYSGFKLSSGSKGVGAASDGLDMGIRITP